MLLNVLERLRIRAGSGEAERNELQHELEVLGRGVGAHPLLRFGDPRMRLGAPSARSLPSSSGSYRPRPPAVTISGARLADQ